MCVCVRGGGLSPPCFHLVTALKCSNTCALFYRPIGSERSWKNKRWAASVNGLYNTSLDSEYCKAKRNFPEKQKALFLLVESGQITSEIIKLVLEWPLKVSMSIFTSFDVAPMRSNCFWRVIFGPDCMRRVKVIQCKNNFFFWCEWDRNTCILFSALMFEEVDSSLPIDAWIGG